MIYDVIDPTIVIFPFVGFILLGIAAVIFIVLIIWWAIQSYNNTQYLKEHSIILQLIPRGVQWMIITATYTP